MSFEVCSVKVRPLLISLWVPMPGTNLCSFEMSSVKIIFLVVVLGGPVRRFFYVFSSA